MEEEINIFENARTIVNIFGGLFTGYFAAHYNWWILLLIIPQIFFMGFAIYFGNELKKKL